MENLMCRCAEKEARDTGMLLPCIKFTPRGILECIVYVCKRW